jgi:hypothetical protein
MGWQLVGEIAFGNVMKDGFGSAKVEVVRDKSKINIVNINFIVGTI